MRAGASSALRGPLVAVAVQVLLRPGGHAAQLEDACRCDPR